MPFHFHSKTHASPSRAYLVGLNGFVLLLPSFVFPNPTHRFMRSLIRLFGILAACLAAEASENDRPNILWIVAEDISPFFGCYGDPDADTPYIDALAERSHLFLNAFSTAPICAPSRSSLATGMYATSLGSQNLRSEVRIPNEIQPLARVFTENGYWTALRNKTDYNFDPEGLFDYWKNDTAPWRECPDGKPFFSFMNLGATHEGSGNMSDRAQEALARLPKGRAHDPERIEVPPYFPDTPEMKRLWARYYDLLTVFDIDVQGVLEELEADGLADDTIVFLMADHGLGMPRYKRWLYKTGMHVPLIVHIPKKFRSFSPEGQAASVEEGIVSYIDLPATALALGGIEIPELYQGRPLFSKTRSPIAQREHLFGARDRADDMYDLSRCVFDGRYLYIRHYMPHLPPMQEGYILSATSKESLIELHRVHNAGQDTEISHRLWEPRPFEELYDLQNDPQELRNVADNASLSEIKTRLAGKLRDWILDTRDSAFLPEPEMHRRANASGLTPYEMLQDPDLYPIEEILTAAEAASRKGGFRKSGLEHEDPAIRYWNLMGAIISDKRGASIRSAFEQAMGDESAIVRTIAAEGMGRIGKGARAEDVFRELLQETEPNLFLFVSRAVGIGLEDPSPLEAEIREARQRCLAPPGSERPWKDFMYSAFTCWALEWALVKAGVNEWEDFAN